MASFHLAEIIFAAAFLFMTQLLRHDRIIEQPLPVVNMAVPARSFQIVIYPIAQQRCYMKEEGIDLRVIYIAPVTSIQAMLGGDIQFTGAGSSALVSIAGAHALLTV